MKLIGAGLPRTGTLSQKVALEMLGLGPCYHMVNVLMDLDEAPVWQRALDGEDVWDELLGDFQATVDWPGSFFTRELAEKYPDAKVLLSLRDSETWVRSMRDTIWGIFYGDTLMNDLSTARARVDPKWHSYVEMTKGMWERSGLMPGGSNTSDEDMAAAMDRYHEEIQREIPSDRLLVWSVQEGWEPLCEFLGVPVPDTPFPRLNDSKEFAERVIDGALMVLKEWRAKDAAPDAGPVTTSS
ncbi:MAG TPA: sulfotransferase [Solirubrobacteraceae bacterium]|nr:sulfotransferase [Solirubrobacteraceae bacterium]